MHSSCLPITVSRSDPIYAPKGIKCMNFVRSSCISSNGSRIGVGEKANMVTSFLDHSAIYGSDIKTVVKVRSFNGGRLKTSLKNVLPLEDGNYFSGDDRVNQTPFIAILHSLFVRNHNHLADRLAVLNRHWDEERLFQEARKINIAVYQKIIYDEWLPVFLGNKSSLKFQNVSFNPQIDPSTTNEFAAGAFRFFHSFIGTHFELVGEEGKVRSINVSDSISRARMLDYYYDDILRGLLKQKINLVGYSPEILNKLFKGKLAEGIDLLSFDILRSRDHGVPAYYKFRRMCNMNTNIKVFNDLAPLVTNNGITQLRQNYKSVYDVDLIVAGAMEVISAAKNTSEQDLGFLGPTFDCIITQQFNRFKAGDFYFYSHPGHFTDGKKFDFKFFVHFIDHSFFSPNESHPSVHDGQPVMRELRFAKRASAGISFRVKKQYPRRL